MGIITTARTAFRAALTTFKLTNPNRAQLRKFVGAMVDAGNDWLNKFDEQERGAPVGFAESKAAQFATYVSQLPDVTIADPNPQDDP